uniref:TRAF-type domain-containing protein n=1 Tax=Timema genevievae TaxID=629358 RepID=A0A7R9JWT1_TIMGE|nr:unnamed protein product [Timema genevievae]
MLSQTTEDGEIEVRISNSVLLPVIRCFNCVNGLGIEKVEYRGSGPAFAWRDSGKPFGKTTPSSPERDSNLNLLVGLAQHETSMLANYATKAGIIPVKTIGCGSRFHSCKSEEHSLLCPNEKVPCINAENGCPAIMFRYKRARHLEVCPASVVVCTMEWSRPWMCTHDFKLNPCRTFNSSHKHQLDIALALQDRRMWNKWKEIPAIQSQLGIMCGNIAHNEENYTESINDPENKMHHYRPSQDLADTLTDKFKTRLPVQIKVKTSNLPVTPHIRLHIPKQTPNQISKVKPFLWQVTQKRNLMSKLTNTLVVLSSTAEDGEIEVRISVG